MRESRKQYGRKLISLLLSVIGLIVVFDVLNSTEWSAGLPPHLSRALVIVALILWVGLSFFILRQMRRVLLSLIDARRESRAAAMEPSDGGAASDSDLDARGQTDVRVKMLVKQTFNALAFTLILVEGLHIVQVKVASILVGGAITGVIVGIAAQSTLSNLFAGLLLLALRPMSIGQTVTIRSSLFGGVEYFGTVADMNWFYTRVINNDGKELTIPNSSIVVGVITRLSNQRIQIFTIPMSYAVTPGKVAEELSQAVGKRVHVAVRDFADTTYTIQIEMDRSVNQDALISALSRLKQPPAPEADAGTE